jgi:succinoglycan biosynthesis transport protein ExoP
VQQALLVNTTHGSHVVPVTFTTQNHVLGAAAVNAIMDEYIKDQLGAKERAARKANDWLDTRVAELRNQMRQADDHIATYRASNGLIQGMHACLDAEKVGQRTEDLVQAHADLAAAEARLDASRGQAGASARAAIAPSVVPLHARQDQVRAQLQGLDARFGPNRPDVINLRRRLAEIDQALGAETARVVAATGADARAARRQVASLDADMRDAHQAVDHNAEAEIPLNANAA